VTATRTADAQQARLLAVPAPALVLAAPGRVLTHRPRRPGGPGWLLGVHGGAGVSCLQRAGVELADAERAWPAVDADSAEPPPTGVVVVCRSTVSGLHAARDAAIQHASGRAPAGVVLAGLVVVADAPGRLPAALRALRATVGGTFPCRWDVPWLAEWRLALPAGPLPAPPVVGDLARCLARCLSRDLQVLAGTGPTEQGAF